MAPRRYLNFDLLLEQEGDGRFQARVTDSPLGETPSVRFQLPFDATTLENLLLKLDPGRSGTRRVGSTSEQQAAMDFGGPLYQSIFTGDLLVAWSRSLDRAREEDAGVRLRLRLNDAAAIAGLPWELLYDAKANAFLAQSERTPLVRFLDVPHVPRPITVDGPLRVLAIISSPTDLEELDVEAEWRRIGEALAPRVEAGLVVVDRLPSATIGELGPWLRRHETHVIHFVGHGDFDDRLREGVIYFQDQHGRSSPVTSSVLGPYVRDHDALRMVVLNACRSARVDGADPFGGMAQGLVQQDATAVVAMQFPISDRAAVTFTGEFYGALVDGLPVDQAVSSARKALLADFRDEWATPVLFLRSPDGNIFENVHAVAGDVPPAAPPPPTPDPTLPPPPGPSFLRSVGLWVRQHSVVAAAVGAVVVGLVVVLIVVQQVGGGDGGDVVDADDVFVPAGLPQGAALTDSQLLVSAGEDGEETTVWVIDADTPDGHEVTEGIRREWLPALSPDRRTMIFSRQVPDSERNFELRVGEAASGVSDDALFASLPRECSQHAGRPAWSKPPVDPFLVLLCRDTNRQRLFRFDIGGGMQEIELNDPQGLTIAEWGDPTLSPDGNMVVVWVARTADVAAGTLYAITLDDGVMHRLARGADREYSDPVFSPTDGSLLAYRRNLHPEVDVVDDFDIELARLDGLTLTVERRYELPGTNEEDPSFSPDGTRLVFTSAQPKEQPTTLLVAPVVGGDPVPVVPPPDLPPILKVPAWSER